MLIYFYSNIASKRTESGGGKSASTTLKYLKKYHDVEFFNNIKELKKIKKRPDMILHHNIIDMIEVYNISKKYKIPMTITVNNQVSCTSGTHIIPDNKFGIPYYKSNFYKSFLALYHEKYVRPFNEKLFAYITLPYRYYWLRKKRLNVLNKVAGVTVIGHNIKKFLEINGVKRKIHVCPSPIDDSFLKPINVKRKKNQILYISGGEPFKGIHVLIDAFKKLDREDVNLLIAGTIRKAHKINIKKYPKNIKFLGRIKEEELKKLYYESTFLVFPNLWFEAFSRGWAESIICGCPVLIFKNRGGPFDYFNNKNAYAVDTNMNELIHGMKEMLDNKKLRKKLTQSGLEYAKNNLIASVVIKRLMKIYKEFLDQK